MAIYYERPSGQGRAEYVLCAQNRIKRLSVKPFRGVNKEALYIIFLCS